MNIRLATALAALSVLACAFATPADAHTHDPTKKCAWVHDIAPRMLQGQTSYVSSQRSVRRSVIFNDVIGIEAYSVVVLPAYQYGFAYAMDNGIPGNSSVAVACARSSEYAVSKSADCCAPATTVTPKVSGWFRVRARVLNAPGKAYAGGFVYVRGKNTGITLTLAAAVTTDPNEGGTTVGFDIPGPLGSKLKTSVTVDFDDESESVDEISGQSPSGTFSVPDEEYYIDTDLDLDASADGAPWDEGEAAADLTRHTLSFKTIVGCTHCGVSAVFQQFVDAKRHGVDEATP